MFQGKIEIRNGYIVSLSPKEKTLRIKVDGQEINYENAFACVGFTDSHLHLLIGGEFLSMPDLTNATSEEHCLEILKQKPFFRGNWLFGRGWNQENWKKKEFPTKVSLDKEFPNLPVCLIRQDGHCLWLNSKALEICNIGRETIEPKSGKILKDESGNPTGILIDNAIELVRPFLPDYTKEQYFQFLQQSISYLAKFGITTVHDMDVDPKLIELYQDFFSSNFNKINIRIFLSGSKFETAQIKTKSYETEHLKIVGLKYYMDGALGSYGALLFEPYSDKGETNGLQLLDEKELRQAFKCAAENDLGIAIHAIGDKATHLILKTYKKYLSSNNIKPKFFRIEHCQLVQNEDIPLFKELGIYASIQPIHFIADYDMAEKRIGNRTHFAYPWKTFLQNFVPLCSGSDFPIENPDPIRGIYSFVNREKIDYKNIYGNEQITLHEALESYIISPAYSIGEEPDKIEVGSPANLTILNKNLLEIELDDLDEIEVFATICQGKIIYQK
ncbi:MAG: amidohydrolase [Candidatus Kapaibacteriota bacterium]